MLWSHWLPQSDRLTHTSCDRVVPIGWRPWVITQEEPRWWSHAAVPVDSYISIRQIGAVSELIHVLENGGTLVSPAREARKTFQIMLDVPDSITREMCGLIFRGDYDTK